MISLRIITFATVLAGAACADQPPQAPIVPPGQGISAYITVDNLHAAPGQTVRVTVEVVSGTAVKLGSYTGRLHFSAAALQYKSEVTLSDGLRVSNPRGAATGEIRFAGANAMGFTGTTIYSADFVVRSANYATTLQLKMEELSAAKSLTNLTPQVRLAPQVQLAKPVH